MCKSRLKVGVIITLLQIQYASGEMSIDQKIREGNRKRGFTELDVRLVDGAFMLEGRVEIRYNGTWGTICDDRFTIEAAEVVCNMLGYQRLGATAYMRGAFGEGKGPIWLDELRCHGNENSLEECRHLPWGLHDCWHNEDAGVKCQAKKKYEMERMVTFELDMVVEEGERHKVFQRNKGNHKNAAKHLWKKDIYYKFGDGIDNNAKHLIRDALDEWEAYSCLDFSRDVYNNDYYNKIIFTSNQGDKWCASTYVGMKQGSQEIHLGKECLYPDVILHEIGHALGFYHEHSRADRDKYIRVHYKNITQGKEDQFRKMHIDEYDDFGKPYDYKSIMHYGQFFFSKDESRNLITIEALDPEFQNVIGKAKHPSFLDYKILNAMYECSAECVDVRCPARGFLGKRCRCYCEGNQDDQPIKLCFEEKDCPKPSINTFLFEVLDKINETEVDLTRDSYPDNTVFNVFSTNLNCNFVSELLCESGRWLGRMPNCPVELEIELVKGSDDEGIVELMLNEQRGFICDDNWDDNDATVACRMMGFKFGKAVFEYSANVNKSMPILLDDLKCSGNEETLSECNHNGWGKHNCDHSEVASAKCFHYIDTHVDQQTGVSSNNDCGKIPLKGSNLRKREVRIVGGDEAIKGMHPWQVRIQRLRGRWIHWCGGTIISSQWILSAAHCFDELTSRNAKMSYEDFRVSVGDHDWTKYDENEQTFHIEYLVKHWQYSGRDGINPENDVALLKIDSGADFNNHVQPACLPGEKVSVDYGMKCEVSGWGKHTENGEIQSKLRAVEVTIKGDKECQNLYKHYPIDTQRVFCAGNVTVGVDTCQGDSGGPLVCTIHDRNTVIGITSWGLGCGRPNNPGVYTKVSSFASWIKQQISLHDFVDRDQCETRDICGNGTCTKTVDGFKCTCNEGFEPGQQEICEDINECDGPLNQCAFRCVNTRGSFRCICPMGYQVAADGIYCEDLDECSTHANQCRYACKNLIGSFMCICPEGFREIGRDLCTDTDECKEQPDLCQPGRCRNSQGGFRCVCPRGYRTSTDGKHCSDDRDHCYIEMVRGRCIPTRDKLLSTHSDCCCSVGKAWGRRCEICPRPGTAEYKNLCPRGGGYDPVGSDIDECHMYSNLCVNGRCLNIAGSYRCICMQGYKSNRITGQCVDIDECAVDGTCDHVCQNMIGSYRCYCRRGYFLKMDGRTCSDVDECATGQHSCLHECTNTVGEFDCGCPEGYTKDRNKQCIDINECQLFPGLCKGGGTCVNTEGSFTCQCPAGMEIDSTGKMCLGKRKSSCYLEYSRDRCHRGLDGLFTRPVCCCSVGRAWGQQCEPCPAQDSDQYEALCIDGGTIVGPDFPVDINECQEIPGICMNGDCRNTVGSFTCTCNPGFALHARGLNCTDIDECRISYGICENGVCVNTPGMFRCECNQGYDAVMMDMMCMDVDECATGQHNCPYGCINTVGGFDCVCSEGYKQDRNKQCIDIDECSEQSHLCAPGGQCRNTKGGYLCVCNRGYKLDSTRQKCIDIDECEEGQCEHTCENSAGGFYCGCPEGFVEYWSQCVEIDICTTNPCVFECVPAGLEFMCECPPGFQMIGEGHCIQTISQADFSSLFPPGLELPNNDSLGIVGDAPLEVPLSKRNKRSVMGSGLGHIINTEKLTEWQDSDGDDNDDDNDEALLQRAGGIVIEDIRKRPHKFRPRFLKIAKRQALRKKGNQQRRHKARTHTNTIDYPTVEIQKHVQVILNLSNVSRKTELIKMLPALKGNVKYRISNPEDKLFFLKEKNEIISLHARRKKLHKGMTYQVDIEAIPIHEESTVHGHKEYLGKSIFRFYLNVL